MAEASFPLGTIAKLLDLTPRRVRQLAREGVIPPAEGGRYPLVGAVQGYVRYLRELSPEDAAIQQHRSRRMQMLARKLEIEVQRLTAELLPADEVSEVWARLAAAFRARMLAIPSKLAPELAAEHDPNLVQARLEEEIHHALAELARGEELRSRWRDEAPARDGARDRRPPAPPDGQRVGGSES
jgi:hypothetical protein